MKTFIKSFAVCSISLAFILFPSSFAEPAAMAISSAGAHSTASSVPSETELSSSGQHADFVQTTLDSSLPAEVIPLGTPIGIKIYSDGIIVSGISEVTTDNGKYSPAEQAGIKPGDIIISANGDAMTKTEQFNNFINSCTGDPITLRIRRGDKELSLMATPAKSSADGKFRIGAWVRDSMAGIGTVSFVDPKTGNFGALGHAVSDSDSGTIIPIRSGSVMSASIKGVKKGVSGIPGSLEGIFDFTGDIGLLSANTSKGIFGRMSDTSIYSQRETLPVASKEEVVPGKAYVLCTINGRQPAQYEIEIEKTYTSKAFEEKNMIIRVTDPELLEKTGGIVQGMSGSPIIQNGKVIGAVTHVLINNPEKGYGIFIENMLDEAYGSALKAAA